MSGSAGYQDPTLGGAVDPWDEKLMANHPALKQLNNPLSVLGQFGSLQGLIGKAEPQIPQIPMIAAPTMVPTPDGRSYVQIVNSYRRGKK